jgi:APA family basic amino acid/polyamine antiporter
VLVMSNATRSAAGLLDFMLRLTAAATLWLYVGACVSALVLGIARVAAMIGFAFALWALWGAGLGAGGLFSHRNSQQCHPRHSALAGGEALGGR